ncbi:Gamma-aminobutyric acid receptor subunit alpha-4 [Dermatophagoides farinae]|uniref:Gamma-aminobutyric acid receptor subunit alpha-4 n=1 Tax=Dermatophagoides farinae TaxID=6954 RepID=A0A922IH18_DERFA|nr:Gamma-aminobutyric acid receptor subunit alpha-4 [Dermatophagoides farinae]
MKHFVCLIAMIRKKPPKSSRYKPIKIAVNLTILDTTIDKLENVIVLDMQLKERWKDKRLRMHYYDDDDYDTVDGIGGQKRRKMIENFVLDGKYLTKIWHPISHIRNNAHVTNALFDKPKQTLQKIIEQEKLVENIFINTNETTAFVWISLKMRVNIPIYECHRDDSRMFPFDKIECTFHITNALYDKRTLIYEWDNVKWNHNEYHSGQFYLQQLQTSIVNEPIIELDESGNEHSIMRIDFMLNRQIGDYILNIYVLHIFLLILSISIFWISIQNIIIRISLSIIILIIIKFQTFQTLKEEQRIITALSIWTFGLSFLIIMAILCHILSYYSFQHKWNEKILDHLIEKCRHQSSSTTTSISQSQSPSMTDMNSSNEPTNDDRINNLSSSSQTSSSCNDKSLNEKLKLIKKQWNKWKRNLLIRLNSMIVNNIKSNHSYDDTNIVDIISRIILIIIYSMFIVIYFIKYAI